MILLRLIGGLGNQMSQVAYSAILAKKINKKLYIDNTSYHNYKIRPCSIQKFKLDNNIEFYKDYDNFKYKQLRLSQKSYHLIQYIFGKRKQMGKKWYKFFAKMGHYYSFDSDYYGFPNPKKKVVDVYGYFLAEEYFHENKDYIKKIFILDDKYISENAKEYYSSIVNCSCSVAISIRLQDDYLKSNVHNVCTKEYFLQAIQVIQEKFPDAYFFVFADDIERAKGLELNIPSTYIENMSDVEGMFLLTKCNHYIISNSSFSWWGAYLGEYSEKVILAPKKWMNNSIDYSSKYYEGVVKIDGK